MKTALFFSLTFLTSILATFATEAPVIEKPDQGDYTIAKLSLKASEKDEDGPKWMQIAFRDGKGARAWLPLYSPAIDASNIQIKDGQISGYVQDQSPAHIPGVRFVYTLKGKVEESKINGTWKRTKNKPDVMFRDKWSLVLDAASGTFSGTLKPSTELEEEQAFAEGTDWAEWHGPTRDRVAAKSEFEIIEDLSQARPVWKSEGLISAAPGRANDIPRHGVKSLYNTASGGGSSPIIADNKVFLNFYLPSGEAYDKNAANHYIQQLDRPENKEYFKGKLPTLVPLKVEADDVVIAVDAQTGELLWRTTFPRGGANHTSHKNDLNNLTMAYANGKVYAIGSTMRLRCLDANSGQLIWEKPVGKITEELETQRAQGVKEGKWIKKRNRDWGVAPIIVDGKVITTDLGSAAVAFDAESGKEIWRTEKVAGKNATPHTWKIDGKTYIIIGAREAIYCLDSENGKSIWSLPAFAYRGVTVSGNILAYRDDIGSPEESIRDTTKIKDPKNRVCVVMELDEEKPKLLWIRKWNLIVDGQKAKGQYSDYVRPQILDNKLFLSGTQWTDCFDVKTGKQLAHLKAQGGVFNAGHLLIAHDRLFSIVDGKHGTTRMAMYTTDPKDFHPTGPDQTWTPPHPNTTSYGPCMLHPLVDGRIFIRGHDAIYCYDLRKL